MTLIGRPPVPFWDRVMKRGEDECWLWTGGKNNSGYGTYLYKGTVCVAHRIAYLLTFDNIEPLAPKDKSVPEFVLHSCDNRLCCNPKHLHLGTYSDNQEEAYLRNRRQQPKGTNHVNAKLTEEQIKEIRFKYKNPFPGSSQVVLAKEYNVSQRCISLIVRGETYL